MVVDFSLLTQNPQFWLLSSWCWYNTFFPCHSCSSHCCCSHCCCCFCFCSCLLCLSLFAILHWKTYRFMFNQSWCLVLFSVGSSTTRIPFDGETALHTARKNTYNDDFACIWDGYWSGTQWRSSHQCCGPIWMHMSWAHQSNLFECFPLWQ